MPGPIKARVGLDVDVQQISGARPLVAIGGLPGHRRAPRQAMAAQNLPHRRVGMTRRSRNQTRSPASVATNLADSLLLADRQQPRTAMRTTAAVDRPRQ